MPSERGHLELFNAIVSFNTALIIEKTKFENPNHIPSCDYIKRLLATAGLPVGIHILEIPTAKQEISNGHSMSYTYPPS